jgi:hypothetical protein
MQLDNYPPIPERMKPLITVDNGKVTIWRYFFQWKREYVDNDGITRTGYETFYKGKSLGFHDNSTTGALLYKAEFSKEHTFFRG